MATLSSLVSSFAQQATHGYEGREAADERGGRDDLARRELARLYERHAPRVRRFLRDLLRDDALAWDATQETFARAFGQAAILRDDERAVPWLFGVARNVSLELRRARGRAGRVITQENGEIERAGAPKCACPEAELLGREALRVIDTALAKMSEERRAVLLLRLDHGLSYEQIAGLMGWSLAKVKVEIFRGRGVLRATMDDHESGVCRGRGAR